MKKSLIIHGVSAESIDLLKSSVVDASKARGGKLSQRIIIEEAISLVSEKVKKELIRKC
jgi:hypothetical protein